MGEARDRIAVALDVPSLEEAREIVVAVRPHIAVAKVGLELYGAAGPDAVRALVDEGIDVFCDLKLHDIPTTVERAARVLGTLGARWVNAHAAGGADMLRAFVAGLEGRAVALAVTVLTSDADAPASLLAERAALAAATGCGGVVCAVGDIDVVRGAAPELRCVTPGVRPAGSATHDQSRIATPGDAVRAGSDLLVVGRAVTHAPDRAAAAAAVEAEVAAALGARTG